MREEIEAVRVGQCFVEMLLVIKMSKLPEADRTISKVFPDRQMSRERSAHRGLYIRGQSDYISFESYL